MAITSFREVSLPLRYSSRNHWIRDTTPCPFGEKGSDMFTEEGSVIAPCLRKGGHTFCAARVRNLWFLRRVVFKAKMPCYCGKGRFCGYDIAHTFFGLQARNLWNGGQTRCPLRQGPSYARIGRFCVYDIASGSKSILCGARGRNL